MSAFNVTEKHVEQWNRDGYLIVPGLLDNEETGMLFDLAKSDMDMKQARDFADAEGRKSKLLIKNELIEDDLYSAVVRSERIARTMDQLLGDEVYHYHHKMMLKEPRQGGAWEWHQDFGYWYNNSCLWPDMGSCAIAVDRATRENGCLQVLRGSHLCGRLGHGTTGEQAGADMERVSELLKRLDLIFVELDPGDGLFFHSNLLHRSDANLSEHPRWTFICCYNTKHNDPYKQNTSGHPNYSPMDIIPDDQVRIIGRKHLKAIRVTD